MAKKFTALSLAALKPAEKRYEIGDAEPGLYIRVAPSGAKSFVVRYKFCGAVKRLTLGSISDLGLAEARDLARMAMRSARLGTDPAREKQQEKAAKIKAEKERQNQSAHLIAAAIENYIGLHAENVSSGKEIDRMLRYDVLPRWGERDIGSITKGDVLALLNEVKGRGSKIMANRLLANVRAFFNWAIANDYAGLTVSPCQGVKSPAAEQKRSRVLSENELYLMLLGLERMADYWSGFFRLLLYTGCRRTEAAKATWTEFDPDKREWFLSEERTKNKRPHLLPFSEELTAALQFNRIHECDYIFSSNGQKPISGFSKAKKQLDREILTIAEELDIAPPPPWRIHDIRRTVATGMAGIGIAPHIVEAVLNHVSGAISGVAGVYNRHGYYNEKKQALAAWARHIAAIERADNASDNVIHLRR